MASLWFFSFPGFCLGQKSDSWICLGICCILVKLGKAAVAITFGDWNIVPENRAGELLFFSHSNWQPSVVGLISCRFLSTAWEGHGLFRFYTFITLDKAQPTQQSCWLIMLLRVNSSDWFFSEFPTGRWAPQRAETSPCFPVSWAPRRARTQRTAVQKSPSTGKRLSSFSTNCWANQSGGTGWGEQHREPPSLASDSPLITQMHLILWNEELLFIKESKNPQSVLFATPRTDKGFRPEYVKNARMVIKS